MKKIILIFSTIIVLIFNGCGINTGYSNDGYNESFYIEFKIFENLGYNTYQNTYIYKIYDYDTGIIDNTNSQDFSYTTDYYDEVIMAKILNSIDRLSINTIEYNYDNQINYSWLNQYNYEVEIQFIGYSGNSRMYNVVFFVDSYYIDSFTAIKYGNTWYLE